MTRRRTALVSVLVLLVSLLVGTTAAQAVVVDTNASGTTVPYSSTDQSGYYGLALVPVDQWEKVPGPDERDQLAAANIPVVTTPGTCTDPWLSSELRLPSSGLCWHAGGRVVRKNETFALIWDPGRDYWATTRNYVEQFLRDVADASGSLSTPYAVTSQYADGPTPANQSQLVNPDRAQNASLYGGGCIDFGAAGGATCKFGSTDGSGTGVNYPANGCPPSGVNGFRLTASGSLTVPPPPNSTCLTDAQLRDPTKGELVAMIKNMGVLGHTEAGYSPLVVLMTPPGVVVCLDSAGTVCSANSSSSVQFCSYHSELTVDGTKIPYVVQPWTALTNCDEPDAPAIPDDPPADVLAKDVGTRLVSPISQASIAAIVNPDLNGWFASDGSEINDNGATPSSLGCTPLGNNLDSVSVGLSGQNPYFLQREFNNAGVMENDPNALGCTGVVDFAPQLVAPSSVHAGDVVAFDGSGTASTLIVPKVGYHWDFGDGGTAVGPSVTHTYAAAGNYTVTLQVTDRGGNQASLSQTVAVQGTGSTSPPPSDNPPPTDNPPPKDDKGGSGSGAGSGSGSGSDQTKTAQKPSASPPSSLQARMQMLPQGLGNVLSKGVAVRVSANDTAKGTATLTIARAVARRAHLKTGRGTSVVVGRASVSGVKNGSMTVHLKLSRGAAKKLGSLKHLKLTVRLVLVSSDGHKLALDAAGSY